jgi:hypothetical protein
LSWTAAKILRINDENYGKYLVRGGELMVFVFNSWVVAGDIDKHEEIMKKLISQYKKIEELRSYRYFGHFAGQDLSPWGGRLGIFEFENYTALESFFKKFNQNKEATSLLNEAMALTDNTTVRFSLLSERNRDLWLERK